MRIVTFCLLSFCFFSTFPLKAQEKEKSKSVSFILHNSYDYPLLKLNQKGEIDSGILVDVAHGIAKVLNKKPNFLNISRARIDQYLIEGRADLSCYARKEWTKNPDDFFWSDELYQVENLVVYKNTTTPIKKISDLQNKRIGTLLNYKYPETADISYTSDGAINMANNFEKLLKNRVEYIFTDSMYYYNLKDEILEKNKIQLEKFTKSKFSILCRLSKKSEISLAELNRSIKTLKERNFFQLTIRKYSPKYQSREKYQTETLFKIAIAE